MSTGSTATAWRRGAMAIAFGAAAAWSATATAASEPDGKAVYRAACAACHDSGAAGAPKLGVADVWRPRFSRGIGELYRSAFAGKGTMPPKGGRASLSRAEIEAAVNYMVLQADPSGARVASAPVRAAAPAAGDASPPKGGSAASASGADGKAVYAASCAACHASGVAGAPKTGDAAAWAQKLKVGLARLQANAIAGKGAMPPKGGNASLSDADVRAAVAYLVGQSGGGKAVADAPAAPAAPAPKAEPTVAAAPTAVPAPAVQAIPVARAPGGPAAAPVAASPNAFNRLMRAPGRRNAPPAEDGIHDPTNEDTHVLQAPLAALGALPPSPSGNRVDWGKALSQGLIAPRTDRLDPSVAPATMDLNIVREVKGSMPDVVYPHKQHTQWLDCANCHPAIFKPQKGANQISMAAIMLGESCGVCHGKVAFPVSECRKCHSKAKTTTAATAK